jgi:hypothetical protein
MHFRWTPPGAPIFFVSLILAVAAVATLYTHVPLVGHFVGTHRFWAMGGRTLGEVVANRRKVWALLRESRKLLRAQRGADDQAERSERCQKRRDEWLGLTQMFNVPKKEPKPGFYYTYFDQACLGSELLYAAEQ